MKSCKGVCTVRSRSQFYVTPVCFALNSFISVALHQSSLVESIAAESLSLCDRGDTKRIASHVSCASCV